MAWTATFLANFEQFDAALRSAEPKLANFDQNVKKVQRSLQTMTSEFDGTKVIQQAGTMATAIEKAGGAAKLTDSELRRVNATLQEALQKYQRMGQDAPAGLRSMADAVSAQLRPLEEAGKKTTLWGSALGSVKTVAAGFVAGFTLDRVLTGIGSAVASTIAWGGALTDMAAKTGVSTTALQRWEFAATRSGATLEDLVKASFELSRRIGEGDTSTVAALDALGLSFEAIRRLSPEQQLQTVAQKLKDVSDQGEFAAVGADLMGSAFRAVAPAIRADLQAVGDEAQRLGIVVNDETVQSMDSLGDAWGDLKLIGRGLLSEVLEPMVPLLDQLARGFMGLSQPGAMTFLEHWAIASGNPIAKIAAGWMAGDRGITRTQDIALAGQSGASLEHLPAYERASFLANGGTVLNSEEHYLKGLAEAERRTREMAAARARAAEAEARYAAVFSAMTATIQRLPLGTTPTLFGGGNTIGGVLPTFGASGVFSPAGTLGRAANPQNPFGSLFGGGVIGVVPPAVLSGAFPEFNLWGGSSQSTHVMGAPGTSYSHLAPRGFNWGQAGAAGLNAAMPFLSQVVAGGSRGSQIGGSIGGSIGGAIGSLSSVIGAVGSFAPFIGPLAGIAGALIGKLFGPSRGAILGREADQRMDQTRAALLQQYGSLDAIAATGRAGQELVAAWGSKNVQGEAHFNNLVRAFEEQNRLLGEQQDLQSEIAGIEAERKQWADSLVTTWDQVVGYAEKYGIHIEGMGPKIVQLGQTATWTDMLNAIQALERAGGDVGGILVGMTDEMSTLVQQSRRAGTEIPSNLKPYIQSVADAGKLLDENGEAITDLKDIKWGEPVKSQADIAKAAMEKLDEAMKNLVDRLDKIIDRLTNGLPAAASTPVPTIRIPYEYENVGGEPGRPDAEPGYASGGLITRPHRAWVGEGGEPELIGPVAFMERALAGAMARIGGGGARVVQVVLDRRVLAEALVDEIPGALRRAGAF